MSATIRCRTTSLPAEVHERQPVDRPQHLFQPEQPRAPTGHVDLGDVSRHDHLRPEADAGEEHLHLFGRRVLGLVQDDEAAVEGPAPHERQRRHLDRAPFEQPLGALGPSMS